ncbi:MAG: DUF1257 domain-containing protein [Verrucomicrobia bacterium]|nr:DUF1257 domain-containing protein [Verrucomicrobiota bacterium]
MSHFTSIKTRMAQKEFLLKALKDLGYAPVEGPVDVRGYLGIRTSVEVKIATHNPEYDIGFRKVGETYQCVADWFGLREIDQTQFIDQLMQRYAYHATLAKLEEQGFAVAEETEKDGRIHLVLRRMVQA